MIGIELEQESPVRISISGGQARTGAGLLRVLLLLRPPQADQDAPQHPGLRLGRRLLLWEAAYRRHRL